MRRRWTDRLVSVFVTLAVTACAGGDLNLPSDPKPARLTVVSGDGQEATAGTEVPAPLVVKVTDADDRPLSDVPVMFGFLDPVPDGIINPAAVQTDSVGRASVRVQLGTVTGAQPVEARVNADVSSDVRATFDLTALREHGGGNGGNKPGDGDDHKDKDKDKGKGHGSGH
jgi:hypothetical protein